MPASPIRRVVMTATLAGALVAARSAESAGFTFTRAADMRASAREFTIGHAHGGVGGLAERRWSYYGVPAAATSCWDTATWRPLVRSGRVDYTLEDAGDAQRGSHRLAVTRAGASITWNRSGDQDPPEFARDGHVLIVFTAPRAMTCAIEGRLTWRLAQAPNAAGVAVSIAVVPTAAGRPPTVLFEEQLREPGPPFDEPRDVPGFVGHPRLRRVVLEAGDRLVFAVRAAAANFRRIIVDDRDVRLVSDLPAPSEAAPAEVAFAEGFFDSGGVRIRYVTAGRGTPVILVHGWAMDLEQNWLDSLVAEELAARHQVVALDCRGMGKSGRPRDAAPAAYGMEMVNDIVRLMDHLHLPKAHVVGFSMGAFITWRFEMSHPDRTLSATHIDVALPGPGDQGRQACCEAAAQRYESGGNLAAAACQRGFEAWAVTDDEARACTVPTMLMRPRLPEGGQEAWPDTRTRQLVPDLVLFHNPDARTHFECYSSVGAIDQLMRFLDSVDAASR